MIAVNTRLLAMNTFSNAQLADQIDSIISHVVDGEATPLEWKTFEERASNEPRLWRELAHAQRDAAALRGALSAAGVIADRVSLPPIAAAPNGDVSSRHEPRGLGHPHLRLNRLGAWTGWAAAAIITIIAAIALRNHEPPGPGPDTAGLPILRQASTSADAWNDYLSLGKQDGTVLGEMPGRMLVETRPVSHGQGFEVIFIRQVMERRVVPDLYEVNGTDETGQPTLTRVRTSPRDTM
jgi:hypothetical protein